MRARSELNSPSIAAMTHLRTCACRAPVSSEFVSPATRGGPFGWDWRAPAMAVGQPAGALGAADVRFSTTLGAFDLGVLGGADSTTPNSALIQFSKAPESCSAGC